MRTLALGGILALAVRRVIHARRALAQALLLDGDADTRCDASWCACQAVDPEGICGDVVRSLVGTDLICGLDAGHAGRHHDEVSDARWTHFYNRRTA